MSRVRFAEIGRSDETLVPRRAAPVRSSKRPNRLRDAVWTGATAAVILLYSLRGGTYDLVARHELAIAVWWILGVSVVMGLLPRRRPTVWVLVALGGSVALLAVTALSLLWTNAADRTEVEIARVTHLLGVMLLVSLLAGRDSLRPMTRGVILGLTAVCVLALASRLAPDAFPSQDAQRVFETTRLSYPLNYWNALAALGAMTVTALVGWSAHNRGFERLLVMALAPVAVTVVFLTYSRAGIGSMTVGLAVLLVASRHRWTVVAHAVVVMLGGVAAIMTVRAHPAIADATGTGGSDSVLLVTLAAGGACVAVAHLTERFGCDRVTLPSRVTRVTLVAITAFALVGAITERDRLIDAWTQFKRPATYATIDPAERLSSFNGYRYSIFSSAVRAFEASPLEGYGAGTFDFWFNRHGGVPYLRDAHSLYLETAAELGLAGLAALVVFLGGLGGGVISTLRRTRADIDGLAPAVVLSSISAIWAVHAGVDWLWESTAVTVVGVGCAVLACAALASAGPPRPLRWAVRAPFVVAVLAAIAVQLPALSSTTLERRSAAAARDGELTAASRLADDAVRVRPWSSTALLQRALVAEQQGQLALAVTYAREAASREPENWQPWLVLARINGRRGDTPAALRAYRRARSLRPASKFFEQPPSSQPG